LEISKASGEKEEEKEEERGVETWGSLMYLRILCTYYADKIGPKSIWESVHGGT